MNNDKEKYYIKFKQGKNEIHIGPIDSSLFSGFLTVIGYLANQGIDAEVNVKGVNEIRCSHVKKLKNGGN